MAKLFSIAATGAGDHVNSFIYRDLSELTPDENGMIITNEGPIKLGDGDYAFKPGIKDIIMWDAIEQEWVEC